jgi:hypothetical protein
VRLLRPHCRGFKRPSQRACAVRLGNHSVFRSPLREAPVNASRSVAQGRPVSPFRDRCSALRYFVRGVPVRDALGSGGKGVCSVHRVIAHRVVAA